MMIYDRLLIQAFYQHYAQKVAAARQATKRPLTLTEKVLSTHTTDIHYAKRSARGKEYALFNPDRVAMQDATAQMALLQFMNTGLKQAAVPVTIHCDHLICACEGAKADLATALNINEEVYNFLQSAAQHYGMGFWKPGAGIIHQVLLENYAFPGGMMLGTDSHTPNAGGLSMAAIGVGGADAVDVMTGNAWELKTPRIIGVKLTGKLSGWVSAKDVILYLAGQLTTKGATNAVIEYLGDGVEDISATGRATICNMGAELGATFSIFPYDKQTAVYLSATGRSEIAMWANQVAKELRSDEDVFVNPTKYYDEFITIDLSSLRPMLNGPFTPDAATAVADMPQKIASMNYPETIEVCLIGSCTNSSYNDLTRAASVVKTMRQAGHELRTQLYICPGSEQVRATAERDGLLSIFAEAGAVILANACGPCIGQWKRTEKPEARRNSIVTTFNRNFAKRADGNPLTHAFIASPEIAAGYAFTGHLTQHPCLMEAWHNFTPQGYDLPPMGFCQGEIQGLEENATPNPNKEIKINTNSKRLQKLQPFKPWDGRDFQQLPLLIKVQGKCTTDHISMAGRWLQYRGHLQNISQNLLLGAFNNFTGQTGSVTDMLSHQTDVPIWQAAEHYRDVAGGSVIVAEDNYGEGSSREHAAMEPRYLGVKAVLCKSFARIHETNLKKQGILALTFTHPNDYDKILPDDRLTLHCASIAPNNNISVTLHHADGTTEIITTCHTYNAKQIAWLRAGSAINYLKSKL